MGEVRYECEGSCGGSVSEEEFAAGKNTCQTEGCENQGQPLVRKEHDADSEDGE